MEIKVGSVRRQGIIWYFGPGSGRALSRGPFNQAPEVRHAVRYYVLAGAPDLGQLHVSAAFFANCYFFEEPPEWHPWQLAGRSDLFRCPVSAMCGDLLKHAPYSARLIQRNVLLEEQD